MDKNTIDDLYTLIDEIPVREGELGKFLRSPCVRRIREKQKTNMSLKDYVATLEIKNDPAL